MNAYFDEAGDRVAVTEFQFPEDEPQAMADDDAARLRQETVQRLLQFLLANAHDPAIVGQRALLLGFLVNAGPARTQSELAKLLGLSDGRISQKLKELRRIRL
jgi:hypothetical protein